MCNKKAIKALKEVKKLINEKISELEGGVTTQDGPKNPLPDCPEGQIRNAQGHCVDDIG